MIPIAEETVFSLDVDTSEAQRKVEDLDESTKSLHDRLESTGGAGRDLGDGISGGAGQGMSSLDQLGGSLDKTGSALDSVGQAGVNAGVQVGNALDGASASSGALSDALDGAGDSAQRMSKVTEQSGGRIRKIFQNAAAESDSMGDSFAKNFSKAAEEGKSFSSSVKTGITGAFDTAKKRVSSFVKDTTSGVKKVGNAFLHPVKTIKGAFSGAMKDAAKGVDNVGDEAKKTEKDLDSMGKSGHRASEKLKTGLGKVVAILGAVAIAAAAVTGITKFVSAALDANQAAQNIQYSFNQTFGDDAPDVEGWADNFSNAVHRSGSEVKNFLTSNRQLYESMGITGEAANDLSKMTTSLAYDLGNFAGIEDSEALSKLQDAIGGNADALSDFGVRLDDATLKQKALEMGLQGNLDELDDATLAQLRFNAIMEQTGDIQGNASKSLGGLTGGIKSVKALWTDFLENAGAKLAPTFDKLFGAILDVWPQVEPALMSFVDLLANGFEQAAPILAEFAANLLPQLLGLAGDLMPILMDIGGQLLPVISQVLGTVAGAIGPLMPLIGTLIKTLLPPLVSLFGTLVETLLPPLASLFGALSPLIDALSPILEIAASAIGLVAEAIAGLIGWLAKGIEKVGEFGQKIKDSPVGQFVGGVGEGISNIAGNVKNFFAGNATGTDDFEGGWTKIHEAGPELIYNRQESGIAYLPKGSAVIPAGKTDEILSDDKKDGGNVINITAQLQERREHPIDQVQPNIELAAPQVEVIAQSGSLQETSAPGDGIVPREKMPQQPDPGWIPVVVEGNPVLNSKHPPDDPDGDDGDPTGNGGDGGGGKPPPPTPEPPGNPDFPAAGGEIVRRSIVELHITVSSPDSSVSPEVLEQFRQVAREEFEKGYDDNLTDLSIQNGYVV